jgi:hypothetical protein
LRLSAPGFRPAPWLTLLVCAGSVASQSATPPTACKVAGRVVTVGAAGDKVPVPANVSEVGTRRVTMTDETGAFVLPGLPPGRIILIIQGIGRPVVRDTLDVVAGEEVHREYTLGPSVWAPWEKARDSLVALGQWPPRLDSGLLEHMRVSRDVRVFRVDPDHPVVGAPPDEEHRAGPWPITGEAHRPSHHLVSELIEALGVASYDISGLYGGPRRLCAAGFRPGVAVRFTREGVPVDVLLCYGCDEISIFRDSRWAQSGDFDDPRFVDFARHVFPHDAQLAPLLARPRPLAH